MKIFIILALIFFSLFLFTKTFPTTITADWKNLNEIKSILLNQTHPSYAFHFAQFKSLRNLALSALNSANVSITNNQNKTKILNYLSPNDYLTFPPYAWPPDAVPTNCANCIDLKTPCDSEGRVFPSQKNPTQYVYCDGHTNYNLLAMSNDKSSFMNVMRYIIRLSYAAYLNPNQAESKIFSQRAAQYLECFFLNNKTKMNPNMIYSQVYLIPNSTKNEGNGGGIIDISDGFCDFIDALILLENFFIPTVIANVKSQWLSLFFQWVDTSEDGLKERAMRNNHGTWFASFYSTMALFLGYENKAITLISQFIIDQGKPPGSIGLLPSIGSQINSTGAQVYEIERGYSWSYQIKNINGLLDVGLVGLTLGIDILHWESKYGGSILKALLFLEKQALGGVPDGVNMKDIDLTSVVNPLKLGAVCYGNKTMDDIANNILKNYTGNGYSSFNAWILTAP